MKRVALVILDDPRGVIAASAPRALLLPLSTPFEPPSVFGALSGFTLSPQGDGTYRLTVPLLGPIRRVEAGDRTVARGDIDVAVPLDTPLRITVENGAHFVMRLERRDVDPLAYLEQAGTWLVLTPPFPETPVDADVRAAFRVVDGVVERAVFVERNNRIHARAADEPTARHHLELERTACTSHVAMLPELVDDLHIGRWRWRAFRDHPGVPLASFIRRARELGNFDDAIAVHLVAQAAQGLAALSSTARDLDVGVRALVGFDGALRRRPWPTLGTLTNAPVTSFAYDARDIFCGDADAGSFIGRYFPPGEVFAAFHPSQQPSGTIPRAVERATRLARELRARYRPVSDAEVASLVRALFPDEHEAERELAEQLAMLGDAGYRELYAKARPPHELGDFTSFTYGADVAGGGVFRRVRRALRELIS